MRVAVILLLVGAAFAASPEVEKFREQRIIGGSVTTISQYPSAVSLIRAPTGTVFTQACGGAILNQRSVLTAAHCFDFQPGAHQWRCRVGSTNANSGGTVFNTQFILIHPQYNRGTVDNDFAIIRWVGTTGWSNNVQPASIAGVNYNLNDNQVVWAIGWGNTAINGWAPSEQLRHVQIWTVNQAVCRQRYGTRNLLISDNMLCSGWLDVGGRDQCQGDSGGPLYHNNVVVGVCSWGLGCADSFFPGVNARVSRGAQWIASNA